MVTDSDTTERDIMTELYFSVSHTVTGLAVRVICV